MNTNEWISDFIEKTRPYRKKNKFITFTNRLIKCFNGVISKLTSSKQEVVLYSRVPDLGEGIGLILRILLEILLL